MIESKDDATFSVSHTPFTITPPKYRCAKHGITSNGCLELWGGGKLEGEYCMECYKDWVRENILPVVRDDAAPGESKEGK